MPSVIPMPPIGFLDEARPHWDALTGYLETTGVIGHCDAVALGRFAECWYEYHCARDIVQEEGRITPTGNGALKIHPAYIQQKELAKEFKQWCGEFGMTPSARSGLKITNPADTDPLAAMLQQRQS